MTKQTKSTKNKTKQFTRAELNKRSGGYGTLPRQEAVAPGNKNAVSRPTRDGNVDDGWGSK